MVVSFGKVRLRTYEIRTHALYFWISIDWQVSVQCKQLEGRPAVIEMEFAVQNILLHDLMIKFHINQNNQKGYIRDFFGSKL